VHNEKEEMTMVRFLPPDPSLDHLRNEAKALHKAHQRKDFDVCPVLRHMGRFREATDDDILSADVRLTEVQFALAREYGLRSWPELRRVVLNLKPAADYAPDAQADAMLLPDSPGGISDPDRFAAAFSMALSYVEAPADYESVAGDTGLAFIFQADSLHRPHGADVKNLDIGWWPVAEWGVAMRLDFLGQVCGVPVRRLQYVVTEYRNDPVQHYREYLEAGIAACVEGGRPVVVLEGDIAVVFGLDDGEPPLLVQRAGDPEPNLVRATRYPWQAFVLDAPGTCIDRDQADIAAIDYAIRLGRDEVDVSHLPGKSSGRRSWELWASQLADEDLCGPHFYHANVVGVLRKHRRVAASYLRTMSKRHPGTAGELLREAAAAYDDVLKLLAQADTSQQQIATADGRARLISLIQETVPREAAAQAKMADALEGMR
jgi:hypothetical protein